MGKSEKGEQDRKWGTPAPTEHSFIDWSTEAENEWVNRNSNSWSGGNRMEDNWKEEPRKVEEERTEETEVLAWQTWE